MGEDADFDPQRVRGLIAQGSVELAISYMTKFIERGSVRAMIAMADYLFDCGDKSGSLAWMDRAEKAAAADDVVSPIYLASAYERGLGIGTRPERQQKALTLLERVGESGNLSVIHALMTNYLHGLNGAPKDHDRFIYWTRKAADLGSEAAAKVLRDESQLGEA